MRRAIVTGVSGQDGYYMTMLLLRKGFEVLGLTSNLGRAQNEYRGVVNKALSIVEFDYNKPILLKKIVHKFSPNYIFNFAAKATGQGMFDVPYEIHKLNGCFVVEVLEILRKSPRREDIVFCQASSSEMYGNVTETPQNEKTPFRPKSPYGASKLYAHNMVNIYRSVFGVRCCSAIYYNHESVRRSEQFVTKKIANAAARIKLGLTDTVTLGSLDSKRDWGYAPEYVNAMLKMSVAEKLEDYVIATGHLNSVRDICKIAFEHVDLNYLDFVKTIKSKERVVETLNVRGDPKKINKRLGWSAKKNVKEIMIEIVEHELKKLESKLEL